MTAHAQCAAPEFEDTGEALAEPAGKTDVTSETPFPGLRSFEENEGSYFRGRSAESEDLTRRIVRAPLTVFFGVSGLGKTSLLKAGVFPRLRQKAYLPILIRLNFHEYAGDLVEQVKSQIVRQSDRENIEVIPHPQGETLWEYIHKAQFWRQNTLLKPLLVFDQFEEIFRDERKTDRRVRPFLIQLGDLIENRIPATERKRFAEMEDLPFQLSKQQYRVVVTLREEALPDLEGSLRDIPSIGQNRLRLLPMSGPAAMEVVRQNPDLIDEPVAEELVSIVAASKDARDFKHFKIEPAYLSVFCHELNRERLKRKSQKITRNLLDVNHDEILSGFYERTLASAKYPKAVREFIEDRLITKTGHRASVAKDDAIDEVISESCIENLVKDRLVRVEERSGTDHIELTHDLLTGVIRKSRDERQKQQQLRRLHRQQFIWSFGIVVVTGIAAFMFYQNHKVQKQERILMTQKEELLSLIEENNKQHAAIKKTQEVIELLEDVELGEKNYATIELLKGLRLELVGSGKSLIKAGLRQTDPGTFAMHFVNALESNDEQLAKLAHRKLNALRSKGNKQILEELFYDSNAENDHQFLSQLCAIATTKGLNTAAVETALALVAESPPVWIADFSPQLIATTLQAEQMSQVSDGTKAELSKLRMDLRIEALIYALTIGDEESRQEQRSALGKEFGGSPLLIDKLLKAAKDTDNASFPWHILEIMAANTEDSAWQADGLIKRVEDYIQAMTASSRYGDSTKIQGIRVRIRINQLNPAADARLTRDVIKTLTYKPAPSKHQRPMILAYLHGATLSERHKSRIRKAADTLLAGGQDSRDLAGELNAITDPGLSSR